MASDTESRGAVSAWLGESSANDMGRCCV